MSIRTRLPLLPVLLIVGLASVVRGEDWPAWRGPRGDGTSREKQLPTHWTGSESFRWRVRVPGTGHSSPIVWGDQVFLTSCVESDQTRLLLAFDRRSGEQQWAVRVLRAPLELKHKLNSYASGTPATDGERVYATFLHPEEEPALDPGRTDGRERSPGALVVAAYDLAGGLVWSTSPGDFASIHGFCSSPVLFDELVIVNGDHDGESYLVALNRATGELVWKVKRRHETRSYATPLIRSVGGRIQMALPGSQSVVSYHPLDGAEQWRIDGPTEQFVASMVFNGELWFMTAGYPDRHILAIRPDGSGNVTDSHIVWRTTRGCAYVPSPVICGRYLLVVSDGGVATQFDAATGEVTWTRRMGRRYSASLVTANGLVYFTSDDGITKVVRPGEEFELVATNELGEPCYASPALSRGEIIFRGETHLVCIERP